VSACTGPAAALNERMTRGAGEHRKIVRCRGAGTPSSGGRINEPLHRRGDQDNQADKLPLNNLAGLYMKRARYVDALPIIRRTISQHTANKIVALPVLFQSQAQNLVSTAQALTDSYEIVQRASSSAAAHAVSQLAARFANLGSSFAAIKI